MASIEKRVASDGNVTYRAKVRLKGTPLQTATFTRLTDARKWASGVESAIREGRHFKSSEAKKHTVGEMIDRYIREVLPTKPKSEAKQKSQLEVLKRDLGVYLLADVTPALIGEYRDKLAKGLTYRGTHRSPGTVNRYLAALSHAFTVAVREWGWADDSPVRKVRRFSEPRGRARFLTDDERKRLLERCQASRSKLLYPLVVLAISTGMRRSEMLGLTWDRVDLDRGRVLLEDTKNNERRGVPLSGLALDLLRDLSKVRRLDTRLVFPAPNADRPADLREAWENAVNDAGIEDFRFHDLRHTAASYLAMNGASVAEIAEVLGHKTFQMVKRYSHLSDGHTAGVVAAMNEKIFGGGE